MESAKHVSLPIDIDEILRLPAMERALGLKRTQILNLVDRGELPRPVPCGRRSIGWFRSEIVAVQQTMRASRDKAAAQGTRTHRMKPGRVMAQKRPRGEQAPVAKRDA